MKDERGLLTPYWETRAYDPQRACPKCGNQWDHIHTEHQHLWRIGFADVLRKTCGRCGYKWDELPLDSPHQPSLSSKPGVMPPVVERDDA